MPGKVNAKERPCDSFPEKDVRGKSDYDPAARGQDLDKLGPLAQSSREEAQENQGKRGSVLSGGQARLGLSARAASACGTRAGSGPQPRGRRSLDLTGCLHPSQTSPLHGDHLLWDCCLHWGTCHWRHSSVPQGQWMPWVSLPKQTVWQRDRRPGHLSPAPERQTTATTATTRWLQQFCRFLC